MEKKKNKKKHFMFLRRPSFSCRDNLKDDLTGKKIFKMKKKVGLPEICKFMKETSETYDFF